MTTIRLEPLEDEELKLLVRLLGMKSWPRKRGEQVAPMKEIINLAADFARYVQKNRRHFVLEMRRGEKMTLTRPVEWIVDYKRGKHPGDPNPMGVEESEKATRFHWQGNRDALWAAIAGSQRGAHYEFEMRRLMPANKLYLDAPSSLVLDWLGARLLANGQQFQIVLSCRRCGKPGFRGRARRNNVYCSEKCKDMFIVEKRKKERAKERAESKRNRLEVLPPGSVKRFRRPRR